MKNKAYRMEQSVMDDLGLRYYPSFIFTDEVVHYEGYSLHYRCLQ